MIKNETLANLEELSLNQAVTYTAGQNVMLLAFCNRHTDTGFLQMYILKYKLTTPVLHTHTHTHTHINSGLRASIKPYTRQLKTEACLNSQFNFPAQRVTHDKKKSRVKSFITWFNSYCLIPAQATIDPFLLALLSCCPFTTTDWKVNKGV